MSGNNWPKCGGGTQANDTRLRYHLTSLYALRPVPQDLMELVREIGARAATPRAADGD